MKHIYATKNPGWKAFFIVIFTVWEFLFRVSTPALAQTVSNEGTEFYAVFPSHVPSRNNFGTDLRLANYSIFITSKYASSGRVSVGTFSQAFTVTPNTVTEVRIPRNQAYIDDSEANVILRNRAIRVLVDSGKPKVVVYGHIFAGARSAASLILPKQALGQKYFSMNYPSAGEGANFIAIIGTEADTRVFIRRNKQDLVPGGISLNPGEVYEYLSIEDLTGTEVLTDSASSSCKSIAVFSGSSNSVISTPGCFGNSLDPLYQQNYPTPSWGKTFGFIPFTANAASAGNYLRVVASEDATEVRLGGTVVATLNAGGFYATPLPLTDPTLVVASKPVTVAQFSVSQACSGIDTGDPDMVLLNPIEYNIKDITVYSSTREAIDYKYLNVLLPTAASATFRVNGVVPSVNFTPLPGAPEYSFLQLNLDSYPTSNFNLTASEGFNAIAYGFGEFESYAYSAGTNLASSQTLTAVRKITQEELANACTREEFDFRLVIPDLASQIAWKFENESEIIQNEADLQPVGITRNGKSMYSYLYPRTHAFDSPGQKVIKVTISYPSANACNISQEVIEFYFEVYDPPKAEFTVPAVSCAASVVQFTDKSTAKFKSITKWAWDFGDGQVSQEQNPSHIFAVAGTYQVRLMASNDAGCPGDVYTQSITITAVPKAGFTRPVATCSNNSLTFAASPSPDNPITKWIWNFGDSSAPVEQLQYGAITHTYAKPGTFKITLTVMNASGCQDVFTDSVRLFAPLLEAGKDLIILEGNQVRINIEAEGNNLRYRWVPAVGLDRDDIRNPMASPRENTRYTVTITTGEGCILADQITINVVKDFTVRNTFTPNGDGINDVWTIENLNTNPFAEVNVFNRYGEKLFSSIGYNSPWDGRYKGEELPVGTYYYVIDPKNGQAIKSGSVTILR